MVLCVRIAMLKERERAKNPDLLLLIVATSRKAHLITQCSRGDVEVGLMNQMHYDAATIGNHGFDFGFG